VGGDYVVPVENDSPWIPRLLVRRSTESGELVSAFLSVLAPYEEHSQITAITRLPLTNRKGEPFPETFVALQIDLADGRRDVLMFADPENAARLRPAWPSSRLLVQPELGLRSTADMTFARFSPDGRIERLTLCGGEYFRRGNLVVRLREAVGAYEIDFSSGAPVVLTGDPDNLLRVSGLD
jgi:hypothetical protein